MHQRTPPPSLLCSFRQLTTGDDHLNQKTGTVVGVKRNHRENTCSNQPAAGRAKNILYVCQDIPVSWWPKARTHGPTELPAHFCRKYGRKDRGPRKDLLTSSSSFIISSLIWWPSPAPPFFFGGGCAHSWRSCYNIMWESVPHSKRHHLRVQKCPDFICFLTTRHRWAEQTWYLVLRNVFF